MLIKKNVYLIESGDEFGGNPVIWIPRRLAENEAVVILVDYQKYF
jgi:hypothetical protein